MELLGQPVRSAKLTGRYVAGQGEAHKHIHAHDPVFNCRMVGTFNVAIGSVLPDAPTFAHGKHRYWLLKVNGRYGWASRWRGSDLSVKTWEIITKAPFPESFKSEPLVIELLDRWSDEQARQWAKGQYWFQTYPFCPQQKADSALVWKALDCVGWSNVSVLDIGCSAGFYSFEASRRGAHVWGFDPSAETIEQACAINDHIAMQDVVFSVKDPGGVFDILLYLSVHHQIDPSYSALARTLKDLKRRARRHVFVELILPPEPGDFPVTAEMSEADIDRIVGGTALLKYRHNLRGDRKVYRIDV